MHGLRARVPIESTAGNARSWRAWIARFHDSRSCSDSAHRWYVRFCAVRSKPYFPLFPPSVSMRLTPSRLMMPCGEPRNSAAAWPSAAHTQSRAVAVTEGSGGVLLRVAVPTVIEGQGCRAFVVDLPAGRRC
jgi:hypothetical protein